MKDIAVRTIGASVLAVGLTIAWQQTDFRAVPRPERRWSCETLGRAIAGWMKALG